jgi:alpha-galactosidase
MRCSSVFCTWTILTCMFLTPFTLAQSVSGVWSIKGWTLDNGETNPAVLQLSQSGTELTGMLKTLGFSVGLRGRVHGKHLELFAPWNDTKPVITAKVKKGELRLVAEERKLVAKRAATNEGIPVVSYIEPPAVHEIPSNGLALTPPMGWNSWNVFRHRIDDQTVRMMTDAIVSSGMRDAGYTYVIIDDTWEGVRDAQGNLHSNHKFPDMKALAGYVHSKGLKLGIYSSPGPWTCEGYPGSYGHEEQDARMFASWGIDYLKYDWCSASAVYKDGQLQAINQKMGEALQSTGRPIVFSLSEYGLGGVDKWGPEVGANLWRTTADIRNEWSSMIGNVQRQAPTASRAGPGHWNDPDMLEIGNGMTDDECRTHMSLWALVAAPLLASNDVRNMTSAVRAILINKEVIAVDQDLLGKQASPVRRGDLETWIKPLADGSVAVGVVNLGSIAAKGTVYESDLPLRGEVTEARNLWTHENVTFVDGEYSEYIPRHGVLMLRVR